ncbi:MAG: hypothetical protein RLZZ46_782 [Bacteroidota bacterium]|jgi:hypothetical protein
MKQILAILLISLFLACGSEHAKTEKEPVPADTAEQFQPEKNPNIPKPTERKFNDIARFIAGMSPKADNTVPEKLYNEEWKSFSASFSKRWNSLDSIRYSRMRAFREKEIPLAKEKPDTLFYPFSGPDFLNATTFFPEAKTTIMIALEPPGFLHDMNSISPDSLPGYFKSIEQSLKAVLSFSFFRTLSMAEDFKADELNGAVHLISIFMVRTGHEILDITTARINDKGLITGPDESGPCGIRGIRISYHKENDSEVQHLFYFSADISDNGLAKNNCMKNMINSIKGFYTYVKSASYLMHNTYFSNVRNAILQNSRMVLQDDSGIPVKYFSEDKWNRTLFGTYDKPINLFASRFQKDLKLLYDSTDKDKVKPLPFGIGYDYRQNESNLMLFSRR